MSGEEALAGGLVSVRVGGPCVRAHKWAGVAERAWRAWVSRTGADVCFWWRGGGLLCLGFGQDMKLCQCVGIQFNNKLFIWPRQLICYAAAGNCPRGSLGLSNRQSYNSIARRHVPHTYPPPIVPVGMRFHLATACVSSYAILSPTTDRVQSTPPDDPSEEATSPTPLCTTSKPQAYSVPQSKRQVKVLHAQRPTFCILQPLLMFLRTASATRQGMT